MKERTCSRKLTEHKRRSRGGTGTWRINAMDTTRAKDHLFAKINIRIKRENHDLAKIVLRAPKEFTKSIYLPSDQPKVGELCS